MTRRNALLWKRHGSLAVAAMQLPITEVVHDLTRVDTIFKELDALEQDPSIDALLFLPTERDAPSSSLRDIIEETQDEARSAPEHGKLSFLRSFNVLSRFAARIAEFHKLVAVSWREVIDPLQFGVGLAASLRIASEDTEIMLANPDIDLPPLGGLSYLLPAYLGIARARTLVLSGRSILAREARELGLVDAVVDTEFFESEAVNETQRLVQAHLGLFHQSRPVITVDARILHDHLRKELVAVEAACEKLVVEPAY